MACGDGEVCAAGVCEISCGGGVIECGGACVDPTNDRAHCGGCDVACAEGEACIEGACGVICPPGQALCGGACVDSANDRAHCGGCDVACGAGEICSAGTCALSCGGATPTQCGTSCVDTTSNPAHCGGCGMACPAGAVCNAGSCEASCASGTLDCGGACTSTSFDPSNCGACGTTCGAASNAVPVCAAGSCGGVCSAGYGDCDADLGSTGGDGCETNLATTRTDCGACGNECTAANAVTGCAASACVISGCDSGFANCDGSYANGCEVSTATSRLHCGGCGVACATGEICATGVCIPSGTPTGEDCGSPYPIVDGPNTVTWLGAANDYLIPVPDCVPGSYTIEGPDVVLAYTATATGHARFTMAKPSSQRYVMVASSSCGVVTPTLACTSEYTLPEMSAEIPIVSGTTYYVYVADTSSGTATLPFPLEMRVDVIDCSAVAPDPTVSPADGTTTSTLSPEFVATFATAVSPTMGTITIAGNLGTSLTYDLATSPSQVSFTSSDTVMTIDPGISFPPGELLTITVTGMQDTRCTRPQPTFTWDVTMATPSCMPGAGGVVGTATTTVATGNTSGTEYYVAADTNPGGYVYYGGTTELHRLPKAGGTVEDIELAAGLASANLGYTMLIDGNDIYTFDSKTSGTTGHVWRISRDGGVTWVIEDYATFPSVPLDDFRSATVYDGQIYMVTHEGTTGVATEIWSMPAGAAAPVSATLRASLMGPEDCTSIALDGVSYYLACGTNDELLRVNRTTTVVETISTAIDLSTTNNALHARDLDGDGTADVLYVQNATESVYYVCSPAAATPFVDTLTSWGTGTLNYGLGLDPVANVLWSFDDDVREFVRIQ